MYLGAITVSTATCAGHGNAVQGVAPGALSFTYALVIAVQAQESRVRSTRGDRGRRQVKSRDNARKGHGHASSVERNKVG